MSDDEDASLGVSDGDISSTNLSEGDHGAKDSDTDIRNDGNTPDFGDSPPLLSGYSQTYIVRKQDPERDQGRNRQVRRRMMRG